MKIKDKTSQTTAGNEAVITEKQSHQNMSKAIINFCLKLTLSHDRFIYLFTRYVSYT